MAIAEPLTIEDIRAERAELEADAARCQADLDRCQEQERQAVAARDGAGLEKLWRRRAELERRLASTAEERERLRAALQAIIAPELEAWRQREADRLAALDDARRQATDALNLATRTAETALTTLCRAHSACRPEPLPQALADRAAEAGLPVPAVDAPPLALSVAPISAELAMLTDPEEAMPGVERAPLPLGLDALSPAQVRTIQAAATVLATLPPEWRPAAPFGQSARVGILTGSDQMLAGLTHRAASRLHIDVRDIREAICFLLGAQ